MPADRGLLVGWIGLLGLIFLLHFGLFHIAALAWQAAGVEAKPIMRGPALATSLNDFWSNRWNLAFRQLAHDLVLFPLRRRLGVGGSGAGRVPRIRPNARNGHLAPCRRGLRASHRLLRASGPRDALRTLAAGEGPGEFAGSLLLDVQQMAWLHGILNALGFSLRGLLGWVLAAGERATEVRSRRV